MTPMVWHQGIHDRMGMYRMRREGVEGAPGFDMWKYPLAHEVEIQIPLVVVATDNLFFVNDNFFFVNMQTPDILQAFSKSKFDIWRYPTRSGDTPREIPRRVVVACIDFSSKRFLFRPEILAQDPSEP